jgi:hypothetical protein
MCSLIAPQARQGIYNLQFSISMIGYDVGAKVAWYAKSEQIINNPEADGLRKREYRSPWQYRYRG